MAPKVVKTPSASKSAPKDISAETQGVALPKPREEDIETAYELIHISSDIVAGWSKYQQEIISFYSKRMIEDLELQRNLMTCKSINEIWDLQRSFFENSSKQYSDEVQKLAKLGQHILPTELTGVNDQINQ